jgi:hypothetical protein
MLLGHLGGKAEAVPSKLRGMTWVAVDIGHFLHDGVMNVRRTH